MRKIVSVFCYLMMVMLVMHIGVVSVSALPEITSDVISDSVAAGYLGDANNDGKVTAADARLILRHSAKIELLPDTVHHLADVNGDGKINASDARIALRMASKLEGLFYYGSGDFHIHEYETTFEDPATCAEEGKEIKKCKICGDTKTSTIPKKGHAWKDATCSAPKTCKNCGVTEGSAKGHSYSSADCYSPAKCVVCGTASGKATGHKFNSYGKCTACGVTKKYITDRVGAILEAYEYVEEDLDKALLAFKQRKYGSYIVSTIFAFGDAGVGKMIQECGDSKDLAPAKNCFIRARNIMESAYRSVDDSEGNITLNMSNAIVICEASIEAQKCITEGLVELRTLLQSIA